MTPWLAIVIPAYRSAAYLPACLASVEAAATGVIETIVVNDGSDDAVGAIAATWAAADPAYRRVVTHARRRGLAAARNSGLAEATAPWILWLDSDNVLSPDTLQLLASWMAQDPATDLWIIPAALINDAGQRIGTFYGDKVPWNPIDLLAARPAQILLGNVFDAFAATRRARLPTPCWDETLPYLEDWDLWIRLLFDAKARVGMLPQETGGYRVRAASLSAAFDDRNPAYHDVWIRIFAKILRDRPELPALVRQAVWQQMMQRRHQWLAATVADASPPPPAGEP